MYAIDSLYEAAAKRGPLCVGLDTAPEYIPPQILSALENDAAAILAYNKALIEATVDVCACYKVQIACYEALGLAGMAAYAQTLAAIKRAGGLAIADIKRGDIAATAARYAQAHFSGDFEADFVTLSPYMGMDSIEPWLTLAEERGKGAFVLAVTSNSGRNDFECLEIAGGGRLYTKVADKLAACARTHRGAHGYGIFGMVTGCTGDEAGWLRDTYKELFFLIPGFGAQGGGAEEASRLLTPDGNGGVVNASRSLLKAWQSGRAQEPSLFEAAGAARAAVINARDEIAAACKKI
ncbi:MAG: orotidine-5'-phosphate decarboxylase [Spirochaetaceae bacterium]|jgi:orotidine-5'-phosphate decarboxylase|nr:orotidine-5'-phosphate decarboxylase [Spirochaetaceae bacterium]